MDEFQTVARVSLFVAVFRLVHNAHYLRHIMAGKGLFFAVSALASVPGSRLHWLTGVGVWDSNNLGLYSASDYVRFAGVSCPARWVEFIEASRRPVPR